LAARRHLEEIIRVDSAVDLAAEEASLYARVELGRQRSKTEQDDVAVAELPRIVVMVGMVDLPEDVAAPVDFECSTRSEAPPGLDAILFDRTRSCHKARSRSPDRRPTDA